MLSKLNSTDRYILLIFYENITELTLLYPIPILFPCWQGKGGVRVSRKLKEVIMISNQLE